MINRLLKFLVVLLIVILQISWLSNFEFFRTRLNIVLILLTFFILLLGFKGTLVWAVGAGYLLDYFSSLPFGLITISLLISLVIIYLLFRNVLTNRSFISFILLISVFTLTFNLCLLLGGLFISTLGLIDWNWQFSQLVIIFLQVIFNVVLASLVFLVYTLVTNRLKRSFLIKGNL